MKIVRNDKKDCCRFDELKTGDVFIESYEGDEIIQMKTELVGDGYEPYNAVSLNNGEMYYVEPDIEVRPVRAELVINNI